MTNVTNLLESAVRSLQALENEKEHLLNILWDEGFGGREGGVADESSARDLAEERLAWLREQRNEGSR